MVTLLFREYTNNNNVNKFMHNKCTFNFFKAFNKGKVIYPKFVRTVQQVAFVISFIELTQHILRSITSNTFMFCKFTRIRNTKLVHQYTTSLLNSPNMFIWMITVLVILKLYRYELYSC